MSWLGFKLLARHRRNPLVQRLAKLSRRVVLAHENFDYDARTNGERFVMERLAHGDLRCVFDVGASLGGWSEAAISLFPSAQVHAFEIVPATNARLTENFAEEPRVRVNACGLMDKAGTVDVRWFPGASRLSTVTHFPHSAECQVVSAPVTTGDEYMREAGVTHIDFLKIDVEGAEPFVLQGFARALESGRIDVIQFEYGRVNILTKFLLLDFYNLLEAGGYRIGKIFPDHVAFKPYTLDQEDFVGPNYLAVRGGLEDVIARLAG